MALKCGAMVIGDKKATFLMQSTSGSRELVVTALNDEEYQLPTQKYHQEQRNKTGFAIGGQNSKQEQTPGGKTMLTNKILKFYSMPAVEREMQLKLARRVERKGRNDAKGICSSSSEGRHWFKSSATSQIHGANPSCSSIQFSRNIVNDYIKKGAAKLASCQDQVFPLVSKSLDNTGQVINKEEPWVTQRANLKRKTLEQIRPSHPGLLIRKGIVSRPGDALKVNGMALAERLKVRSTFPHFYKQTTPSIQQHTTCMAPKHWWDYLNEKITKQLMASSRTAPETDKVCKLCQLNGSDHQGNNTGKDVLHIDLKRLTQVRSKDWSSYGHFTGIHKLRYTKRQNNLDEIDEKERRVEVVDEDYLNVDVDRLMKMYEPKESCDVGLRKSAVSLQSRHLGDKDESVNFPPNPKSHSRGHDEGFNNKGFTTFIDGGATDDGDTSIQRPGTTTLRSCLNFTSRKTCFTNVG